MATEARPETSPNDEYPHPQRVPNLLVRALEAAMATTRDDRAWALVRLAADLRVLGDIQTAFVALDAAWHLGPSTEPARAMFSCAIACHCDRADYDIAHAVASEQPEDFHDLKFARAARRLYCTLLGETGEERWAIELQRYRLILDRLDEGNDEPGRRHEGGSADTPRGNCAEHAPEPTAGLMGDR